MAEASKASVRERALALLSRRDHSARELADKLVVQFDPELVLEVVGELAQQGLQSDARFAEVMTRSRIQRGHGPLRIRAELKQKGVAAEAIETALQQQEVDWFHQACVVRQRRFGGAPCAERLEQARQIRFLQYRGFTMEQIQHALAVTEE